MHIIIRDDVRRKPARSSIDFKVYGSRMHWQINALRLYAITGNRTQCSNTEQVPRDTDAPMSPRCHNIHDPNPRGKGIYMLTIY